MHSGVSEEKSQLNDTSSHLLRRRNRRCCSRFLRRMQRLLHLLGILVLLRFLWCFQRNPCDPGSCSAGSKNSNCCRPTAKRDVDVGIPDNCRQGSNETRDYSVHGVTPLKDCAFIITYQNRDGNWHRIELYIPYYYCKSPFILV